MKKLIGFSVIALFVLTITLAAQSSGKTQPAGNGKYINAVMKENFFKQLNLTNDQEKQIRDIRYEQQKKAIDLRSQIQKNRLELRHMISNNNVDEKKIIDLTDINSKILAELRKSAVQTWLSIYKILKPEQQEIWIKHFGQIGHRLNANIRNKIMQRMDSRRPMRMQRFNNYDKPMGMINNEEDETLGMTVYDEQGLIEPAIFDNIEPLEPQVYDPGEPIGMQLFDNEYPAETSESDSNNLLQMQ